MSLILIILVLLLIFGGGGYWGVRQGWYGVGPFGGFLGLAIVVIIILAVMGRI